MLLDAGSTGRGDSYDKVCESDALLGRIEGNTFHGNGTSFNYSNIWCNFCKSLVCQQLMCVLNKRAIWNIQLRCVYLWGPTKSRCNDVIHAHCWILFFAGGNYAKPTDQSILTDGHNIDKSLCNGFDGEGHSRGQGGAIVDNVDYGNTFVGKSQYWLCDVCSYSPNVNYSHWW